MTVEIDDVLRVSGRLTFDNNEDDIVGVHHYEVTGGSETDAQTLINIGIVMESIYATVVGRQSQDISYEEITVKNVTQNVILGDTPWPTLVAGALADDALPPQVTALVLASTPSPTRQGRKYAGGFVELDNVGGLLAGALVAALGNFADNYVLTQVIGPINYRPVIMSSPDGPLQPIFPLLVGKVILAFRTQRRRTLGRGS